VTTVIGTFACRDLVELVTDYLEGALAPEVHAAVEEHLRGCDGCTAYVAQIQATVDALGETTAPPLDPQLCARLEAAFRTWSGTRETPAAACNGGRAGGDCTA
jgi:anti-sigma factor RsiW